MRKKGGGGAVDGGGGKGGGGRVLRSPKHTSGPLLLLTLVGPGQLK